MRQPCTRAISAVKSVGGFSHLLIVPYRRRVSAASVLMALSMTALACTPAARPAPTRGDDPLGLLSIQWRAEEACCWQRPDCDLPPRPFTTDGCTLWPDGDWGSCCLEHDIAYWCGGTSAARQRADDALRACVETRQGEWFATMTYLGVRVGGGSWLPAPWRWGYGWDWLGDPE